MGSALAQEWKFQLAYASPPPSGTDSLSHSKTQLVLWLFLPDWSMVAKESVFFILERAVASTSLEAPRPSGGTLSPVLLPRLEFFHLTGL